MSRVRAWRKGRRSRRAPRCPSRSHQSRSPSSSRRRHVSRRHVPPPAPIRDLTRKEPPKMLTLTRINRSGITRTSRAAVTSGTARRRLPAARAVAWLAAAAAVSVLAGCGSSGTSSTTPSTKSSSSPSPTPGSTVLAGASCKSSGATNITFWAWVPGIDRAVTEFNKTHPSICVTQEDVGAGSPEYVKIADALKAGSGAPDVAEVEFDELPSFEVTHNVVNLVPYGANKYKSNFVPWAWKEVSQGPAVYAMPGDAGPMAFYYNSKLLAKYHISPPTTWAQFATDAAALKKADPSAYITNFSATDLQWVMSLMAQDNAWPFAYSGGSKVTINWTGPAQLKFAAYWQKLLNAHEVNGTTDVSAT